MYWPFISWIMNLVIMHHSDWQSHYVKSSWGVGVTNNLDVVVCHHGFESIITTFITLGIELLCVLHSEGIFLKTTSLLRQSPLSEHGSRFAAASCKAEYKTTGFRGRSDREVVGSMPRKKLQILLTALNTFKDKDLYGAKLKYLMIWSNRGKPWH